MNLLTRTFFIAFAMASLASTWTGKSFYPFNPYKMFSKDWLKGREISGVEMVDAKGLAHRPWTDVQAPFFQVNRILFTTYYGGGSEAVRARVCDWMRTRSRSSSLGFEGVVNVYERKGEYIKRSESFRERAYVCSKPI